MIKFVSAELSHKTVNVGNQFIIRVQTEEVFPTWGDLRVDNTGVYVQEGE